MRRAGPQRSGAGWPSEAPPHSPPQPTNGRRGAATSWWEGRAVCGARWYECPASAARGSRAAAASAGLAPSSRLRVGLPRQSLAAPRSAMSKPPPKPVKPGKSSARRACGCPGCGARSRSSRRAPSGSLRTSRRDGPASEVVAAPRSRPLPHSSACHCQVGVLDRPANGKCAAAGWGLHPLPAGPGGEQAGDPGSPGSFGELHPRCQRDGLVRDPLGSSH